MSNRSPRLFTLNRTQRSLLIGAVVMIVSLGAAQESDDKESSSAAAARALLQSLPEAKRTQAALPFDSSERTKWNYVPTKRAGVALAELDVHQRALIDPLLRSALSPAGFRTAENIVQHESI